MSDLLGSKLAPSRQGGRASGGIQIRAGGSTGGSGTLPQFSLDGRGKKVPAMEGEGSEADLAAFVRSMRDRPRDGVHPSGPGESSAVILLPEFPHEIPYTTLAEQRMYQIRWAPVPKSVSFPDVADEEVISLLLLLLVLPLHSCNVRHFLLFRWFGYR